MNNIFTKKFMLTSVSVLIVVILAIISCKKHDELSNSSMHKSQLMQFYDSKLIESFKNEPIAKEFLRELNNTPIKVVNGILSFNCIEDLNKVYDLIIAYTNKYDELIDKNENYSKYAQSDLMPDFIMPYLFESQLDFYSLRAEIEEQVLRLERGAGIPDDNDPDDHYTVSPYMRTLLTPQCELIIDGLICVYYDTYAIGIMDFDWNTLNQLHQYQNLNNSDERKALAFCTQTPNAFFLTTGDEPILAVDFIYTVDPRTPNTIQFNNYSCSEAYKYMEYLWDFGDGTTSTEKNPKHTFSPETRGTISVCLTTTIQNSQNNGGNNRAQSTGCQTITFPPAPNPPSITYSEGNNGLVSFSIKDYDMSTVSSCTWNFGDQTPQQVLGSSAFATHTYTTSGSFNVVLTMLLKDMLTRVTLEKTIQVKKISTGGGCCVKSNTREVEKNFLYNNDTRRVKQVMRVTNALGFHRIVAKTKNQKKTSINTWVAKKVDEINVGCFGIIYKVNENCWDCNCPWAIDMVETVKKNWNQRVMDEGTGGVKFTVGKGTLWATHYVKDDDVIIINGRGTAVVHDETCD